MRMYIIAGTIGSGITEVAREVWEELFSRGFRSARKVQGRPDKIEINSSLTQEEVIANIEAQLVNSVNTVDVIISGADINRHALAIRNHWKEESRIIFVRKADPARNLEAGLSLLEHHVDFDRAAYTQWMQSQIDAVNGAAAEVGAEWKDVVVLDMFNFDADKLSESDQMVDELIRINEYTGSKSSDCVPRQLAIY